MICLKVLDVQSNAIAVSRGDNEVNLIYSQEYNEGDKIVLEIDNNDTFIWLQFDDAIGRSLVFLKENNFKYEIPFGDRRVNLSPKSFYGNKHLITAKIAKDFEIKQYRNLAYSTVDYNKNTAFFPHAVANVETRGESVFAAQNAIDGITSNSSHGEWPFQSWGINQQSDAKLKIDFGRKVVVDRVHIYLRADFPHDNWWENAQLLFSDGTSLTINLEKTDVSQEFTFEKKTITWIEIGNLIKSSDPSPFPALTQIEVYGVEYEK